MSKFQYYTTIQLVKFFLREGKEGECWDFKQEWHESMASLIKDIICFANTVHDEDCYIIFGVADDLTITGMTKPRKKQADVIDAISNLLFAGDTYPKIEVETITIDNTQIDVLKIFNIKNTPVYLKKRYGEMNPGCIYLRTGDKNTPDNGNADISDIQNLWKKRFGLTKSQLEYIYDRLHNKLEWVENNNVFYNIYHPEYTITITDDEKDLQPEFYAYTMINRSTFYEELSIKYQNTVLKNYQLVVLDGGRLQIPIPEWGFICHDKYGVNSKYSYKFYVCGDDRYRLFRFLYDGKNSEQRFAFSRLQEVVVFYYSEEERVAFEAYIEENPELLNEKIKDITRFEKLNTENTTKTEVYKERLTVGLALNDILASWREKLI